MFENLQKKSDKIDDIFAETDSAGLNPLSENNQKSSNFGLAGQKNEMTGKPELDAKNEKDFNSSFDSSEKKGGGIIKKMFILIIVFVLIGAGAYFVYSQILLPGSSNNQDLISQSQNNLTDNNNNNDSLTDESFDENFQQGEDIFNDELLDEAQTEDNLEPVEDVSPEDVLKNIDSDGDGLSDYEEIYIYKTDPYNQDSDGDGLSDYEEVMIFGTDPLSADTDGDTYFDGQEILSGYNPLGGGIIDVSLFKSEELFRTNFMDLVEKFNL